MDLRQQLISTALEWQGRFGVAPAITSALSEYDAALLVGCPEEHYSSYMQDKTAVAKGTDFVYDGKRYQVKANRPSGKPGSRVTWVPKAKNYEWDYLIWIHYTTGYAIHEAWLWSVTDYHLAFDSLSRLSPAHMRMGKQLNLLQPGHCGGLSTEPPVNRHAGKKMGGEMLSENPVQIQHKAILLNINKLYRNDMSAEELYEATRGVWRVGARRNNAEFAMAVYQETVREVYRINKWYPAATLSYKTRDVSAYQDDDRWEFDGTVAEDVRDEYVGAWVGKGYQNPVRYINA